MSKRDTHATLSQIAEHAQHAQDLCAGRTPAELVADWKSSLALETVKKMIRDSTSGGRLV
jgi:hypothetical protein